MRQFPLWLALVAVTVFGTNAPLHAEDARLEKFFREYLDESFAMRPLDATRLGDHRFDHLLDDISPAARAKWLSQNQRALAQLPQQIDYKKLTRAGQIDFEIWQQDLIRSIWLAQNTDPFADDPRVYGDYANDGVYLLLTQSTRPREENIRNAVARMAFIPRLLDVAKTELKNPPKSILETAVRQNRGSIHFYESSLFDLVKDPSEKEQLQRAAAPVVAALKRHQQVLDDLLPRASGDWRLGREKFGRKLELVLDADLTADQVLQMAEGEFAKVRGEMTVLARQLWASFFPKLPLPPDDEAGQREMIARVLGAIAQNHGKAETLIDDAQATANRVRSFIRDRDILKLPDPDRCQIIEMPEFRRGNSLAYLEPALPLDPEGASFYAISPPPADWEPKRTQSFLEEYNRYLLQVLTIHEAYPGHYVQLEYANRTPSLIRKILSSGVFAEGWAVYTEQMMLDQGYGDGDLALRLSQLKFLLRAVTNTILDHRMHCDGITDDEAYDLLTQKAFQSEGEARLKIIRAKQSSVQLSTYFVGRSAFVRLRRQIQRELGETFILGRFHEATLGEGTIPVKYLPELVKARLVTKP